MSFWVKPGTTVLVWLLPLLPAVAQTEASYHLLQSIRAAAVDFTTDKLQNVYLSTPDNEVIKYNAAGREEFRYSNKTLGGRVLLDATNPFQLLLFFPEYGTALTLDRTLNLMSRIDLPRLGFFQVFALGRSSDNHLWLYDEVSFRLRKIAADGSVLIESNDLSLALGRAIHPTGLVEKEQLVFVNDPQVGILVFDVFGQYLKTLDLPGIEFFQVDDEKLLFSKADKLEVFHLKAHLVQPIPLPQEVGHWEKVRFEKDRLYVFSRRELKIYSF